MKHPHQLSHPLSQQPSHQLPTRPLPQRSLRGAAWRTVLYGALLSLVTACTTPPDGVTPFDVTRYAGKWFEVARLSNAPYRTVRQAAPRSERWGKGWGDSCWDSCWDSCCESWCESWCDSRCGCFIGDDYAQTRGRKGSHAALAGFAGFACAPPRPRPQPTLRPVTSWYTTMMTAATSKMCSRPPAVNDVTKPSTQRTRRTIAIV